MASEEEAEAMSTRRILSRVADPASYSDRSDEELRSLLQNNPILIDGGTKSFELDTETGKKCFILSATGLRIDWGEDRRYWTWVKRRDSRFEKVAKLLDVCRLHISGSINTADLSPKTTYVAYLLYKLTADSDGLRNPVNASIATDKKSVKVKIRLDPSENDALDDELDMMSRAQRFGRPGRQNVAERKRATEPVELPVVRNKWMEVRLGEFFTGEGAGRDVKITAARAVVNQHWKRGLIVEGIAVRPKRSDDLKKT